MRGISASQLAALNELYTKAGDNTIPGAWLLEASLPASKLAFTPATGVQGTHADTAFAWGDHAAAGYAPGVHTHVEANITDLDKYTQAQVDTLLSGKSDTTHNHDTTYLKVDGSNAVAATFKGAHQAADATPGATADVVVGAVTLHFKDGLFTGTTP